MPRPLHSSGITLVELLIGVVLLAVLLGLAAPSFQSQLAASQLTSATQALLGSLLQARAQAMRLGQRVTVCRTVDQQQCDTGIASGWETGWLTFIDAERAGNSSAQVSPGDTLLSRSEALPSVLRVTGNSQVDQYISFGATGEARFMGGGTTVLGTIRVCSTSPALQDALRARDLVLAAGGRLVSRNTSSPVSATCPSP